MRSFTAYLNDPAAVSGTAPLMRQKRAVDDAAERLGGRVSTYAVDSGRRFAGQRTGDALLRILADLGRGDEVVVESVARLAADAEAIDAVVGTFALLGIGLVEAGAPQDDGCPFEAIRQGDAGDGVDATRPAPPAFPADARLVEAAA